MVRKTKVNLFSGKSLLISLKGIASSIITMLTAIPLWALSYYFASNGNLAIGMLFSLLTFVWYLFFWGFISNKWWSWK